jgi:hypothetical protein
MLREKINQLGLGTALLITVLAFGSFAGAVAVVTNNQFGFDPITSADDGESEDSDEDEDRDEDEGDDKDKDEEKEKERAEKEREKSKKEAEKRTEQSRKSNSFDDRDDDVDEDDDENKEENKNDDDNDDFDEEDEDDVDGDDEDDSNAMFKDRDKTLSKLEKEISEAEKEILEKQAEGVDVTAALARLASAKAAIGSVASAFDIGNLEEAKRLAKEVKKLTHFARGDDLHDAKEIAEDIAKVAKRIAQVRKKIAELKALGGDTGSFETMLIDAEKMFADAKTLIGNGGTNVFLGIAELEGIERRVKNIKHAVENAIFALGGEDDDFDDDHRSEVADFVKHLNEVADIEEGGIGKQVRIVARAQSLSAEKVASLSNDVKGRSDLIRFLIGPKSDDLDEIQEEIAANNARIAILNKIIGQVDDADIKSMLAEQVTVLEQETANLTSFVNGELDKSTLLAWLGSFAPKF